MENIKFVKEIMGSCENGITYYDLGNCRYYPFDNGNTGKVYVKENGVTCEIINNARGKIDECYFPFCNYFTQVQCSAGAPLWYQHIDKGRWYFSQTYKHVLPTENDFKRIRDAVHVYFTLFSN